VALLQRVHKLLVVSLLIAVVGAHWAVLQSVAWVGMLFRYSDHATISQAWTKTFSGKYPCRLCKLVKEGRKSEQKQETLKFDTKFEFTFIAGAAWFYPPRPRQQCTARDEYAALRDESPPLPPPRSV